MNLNLKAPDRAAKTLASVKVKAEVTVPAGLKTFRFPSLAVKEPVTVKQGDIGVTLEGTEVDEQVWKVNVVLAYPGEGPAFESYRQGLFNNRLWLQKADGSRFEHNGGFSNTVVRRRQARLRVPLRRRPRQARRLRARLRDPEQGADDPAGVRVQGRAAALIATKRRAGWPPRSAKPDPTGRPPHRLPRELGRIPDHRAGDRRSARPPGV